MRKSISLVAVVLLAAAGCGSSSSSSSSSPAASAPQPTATVTAAPPTASPKPPSTPIPHATPNPLPDPAQAEAAIHALGGTIPAGATAKSGTEQIVENLDWQMYSIGDWRVAWDASGQVANVFHHPPAKMPANKLKSATAIAAAKGFLGKLGVTLPSGATSAPTAELYPDNYWVVIWPRVAAGVPVDGDEIMVSVLGNGGFFEYTRIWRPLGAKPATPLSEAAALAKVPDCAAAGKCKAGVEWYSPTDLDAPGDPLAPLKLGWLIRVANSPLYVVDAQTGDVIPIP